MLTSNAIRATVADLKLAELYQANVRLTGPVAMADEEFATIKEKALLNGTITILLILFILWHALRSGRIILAVFLNLVVGLAITAALGLLMVGSLPKQRAARKAYMILRKPLVVGTTRAEPRPYPQKRISDPIWHSTRLKSVC